MRSDRQSNSNNSHELVNAIWSKVEACEPTIIYAQTRKEAEKICANLRNEGGLAAYLDHFRLCMGLTHLYYDTLCATAPYRDHLYYEALRSCGNIIAL